MTFTFQDMAIFKFHVGHFEFLLSEAVAGFRSGASPSNIAIYMQKKPPANFGAFVPPVTVILLSQPTKISKSYFMGKGTKIACLVKAFCLQK